MKVAIIGRPNVGKSTLFNKLIGKEHAIVEDTPGVTRDRREGSANIGPMEFDVIDTAGLEKTSSKELEARMMEQTEFAVLDADVILLVIDGTVGVTTEDQYFAKWLRKKGKPAILVVNKCEGKKGDVGVAESYKLGFPETIFVSSAHNLGFDALYEVLEPYHDKYHKDKKKTKEAPIQVAIIGRPNAGKSTLTNKLLDYERMVTGPEAGITRDSIAIDTEYKGRAIKIVDTAGLRRKSKIKTKLEKMSSVDTMRAVQYAQIVVILLDATMALEKQDISIADLAIREGRCVIIAMNKWDLVEDRNKSAPELKRKVENLLPAIRGVPVVFISALTGDKVDKVMEATFDSYDIWNKRIKTAELNEWIRHITQQHPIPLSPSGKRPRIKFITQHKTRPPTFLLSTNLPKAIDKTYIRYLTNSMRRDFDFMGVPLRFVPRKVNNPYDN